MKRQSARRPLFSTLCRSYPRGSALGLHAHQEAQLIYAATGTMLVHTEIGRWLVPPQLAVWVPAGLAHAIDMLVPVQMWTVYYDRRAYQKWGPAKLSEREFALRVTPLLRVLIATLFEERSQEMKTELIVRLILQELTETPDAPTFLPLPESELGRRVAHLALADSRARLDMAELAYRAGTSARTLSRLFPVETGLTFRSWRQRARIVAAVDALSSGVSVGQAAVRSGFATTAAFSFAFRQVVGTTAGEFLSGRLSSEKVVADGVAR